MWISKKNLRNKLMDARLESHRNFLESQQERRIAKLEQQVKQLKKIIKEGY